ncbi:MAG TPA: hypothetical protein PLH57_06370, partial [Oligoflexia bacterium]|nr:hypothetical protein [Oligoflexia bacterium]
MFDLNKIQTYSLRDRPSKVEVKDFAQIPSTDAVLAMNKWFDTLPEILAAKDLRLLARAVVECRNRKKPIVWGMGSHVLKTGLAPLLIDLMNEGFITGLAFNGSALIHDFETAFAGKTSEDVDSAIGDGDFGMARETGEIVNQEISKGVASGLGLGGSIGKHIAESDYPYKDLSLFAHAYKCGLPATVHVAIGTDILHMHPKCDGAALGLGSHRDFLRFAESVSLMEGGAYINFGSAVILPEVFLKAITLARNLGATVNQIVTANFDFINQYRGRVNVVQRPVLAGGEGFE